MERNANYAIVGLFVIVFSLSALGFIFWFGKYGSKQAEFDNYKCYFTESVSGLNKESPVKFKGVNIGSVISIRIDPKDAERIEVGLKVAKGSPIKEDNFITLNSQGITGLNYLEIKGGSKDGKYLKDIDKNSVPEIKTEPSLIMKLGDKAESLSGNISNVLSKIDRVMSEKNIKSIDSTFENLQKLSDELKNDRHEIKKLLSNGVQLETKSDEAVEKLSNTIDKANLAITNSNGLIDEMKILSTDGQTLVKDLRDSPSDILFKQKPIKLGPGEK
jgi:phospholipid/cholesterol/gamma-HCH transport system substrate-binding protein